MGDFNQSEYLPHILTGPNVLEMSAASVGPNLSLHYISITFAPLHIILNYICHNLSGFSAWSAKKRDTFLHIHPTSLTHWSLEVMSVKLKVSFPNPCYGYNS